MCVAKIISKQLVPQLLVEINQLVSWGMWVSASGAKAAEV